MRLVGFIFGAIWSIFFLVYIMYFVFLRQENHSDDAWSFLALGDSYTIGEGIDSTGCWPNQLTVRLNERGSLMDDARIIAKTGWTTSELMSAVKQARPQGPFDLVSLLIGVNNQYRGPEKGYTPDVFRLELAQLLQQSVALAGGDAKKVMVVSIPDYGVTPFVAEHDKHRVSVEIDTYNRIKLEECEKIGVVFVDITPISRLAASDQSLLAGDGLHPSAEMYRMWVDLMIPEIEMMKR